MINLFSWLSELRTIKRIQLINEIKSLGLLTEIRDELKLINSVADFKAMKQEMKGGKKTKNGRSRF